MANQEAFEKGFDLGMGKPKKKKTDIPQFKHGGKVKKTGPAVLHKGEYVAPAKHRSKKKSSRKKTVSKN
jgi:hypothetical protein